jgi:hypothetical protein
MLKTLSILFMGLLSLGAQAQQKQLYWGAELGSSTLGDATADLNNVLVSRFGGSASSTQDKSIGMFKIVGGYRYNEFVDMELAYLQSNSAKSNFKGVSSGSNAYSGNATVTFSGIEYAVNFRPSISSGWNGAYFRIGGHNIKLTSKVSITGTQTQQFTDSTSGAGLLYGVGYDTALNTSTKVRFSAVKYFKFAGEYEDTASFLSLGLVRDF